VRPKASKAMLNLPQWTKTNITKDVHHRLCYPWSGARRLVKKKPMEERTWRKGKFWDESRRPNETSQQQVQRMGDNRRM